MSEKKAQPRIFRGELSDEELVEYLSDVVGKIKFRKITKNTAQDLHARAEAVDKELAELNKFIYLSCYVKEPDAIPECEKLESGGGIKNKKASKVMLFNQHSKGPFLDDGFLRNRVVVELAAMLCQSLVEWCAEVGIEKIRLDDFDAAHGLTKMMVTREKGGKFSPPNY